MLFQDKDIHVNISLPHVNLNFPTDFRIDMLHLDGQIYYKKKNDRAVRERQTAWPMHRVIEVLV